MPSQIFHQPSLLMGILDNVLKVAQVATVVGMATATWQWILQHKK